MPRWMPVYEDDMTHWLWDNAQRYQWWLEIRFRAAKTPGMRYVGDTNIRIRVTYGEWPVTIAYLGTRWHADERAVISFLEALEEDGLITRRKNGLVTVISVCGFEKYCFNMQNNGKAPLPEGSVDIEYEMQNPEHDTPLGCISDKTQIEKHCATRSDTADETQSRTRPYLHKRKEIKNLLIDGKREREKDFLEKLKKSESTLEGMAMSLHCELSDLLAVADDFSNATITTEDWHPTFSAFKKHFLNWARMRIKKSKDEVPQKNKSAGGYQPNAGRRRGPVTPDCGLNED